MNLKQNSISPLAQVELDALEAGREWTRKKIERDLQKLADQQGEFSPLRQLPSRSDPLASDSSEDKRGNR